MNFGENLKILRKNSKLSQEVLANKIGVARQSVSKWEVGDAYPEMSNIVALCSIFHCNINDLINDNIVDIESFDKETKDSIVKFKKEQQKKMKGISKSIYIITNIVKYILISTLIFPFISKTFTIDDNKITLLNKEYEYTINSDSISVNNKKYYVETKTDLKEFINSHNNTFFRISIEYILICLLITTIFTILSLHYITKLYKNIYTGSTPFTIENEKYVIKAIVFMFAEGLLNKITALIYSFISKLDLAIEFNIKDLIFLLIGISTIYIFKYGRMIQADTEAKMYD